MPGEGRGLSSRPTQDVVRDREIGQPSNSEKCSETADGVTRESEGGSRLSLLRPVRQDQPRRHSGVNAGEKMHQRAGVKLHQDGMPKACIGGLLLGDKQDEKRIASPENVTQASSVASPPMFPLPH